MKNSNYKLLKTILIIVLFISSSKSYSQEKFQNNNLFNLEKIAFGSNFKNFKKYMKELNYMLYHESGDFYDYINKYGNKVMFYTSKKQIQGISISELNAEDIELIEVNLKENKFIEIQETGGKRYNKKSYPFSFFIHNARDGQTSITAYKI